MKIIRNPELKRELLIDLSITAAAALIGFIIRPIYGIAALAVGLLFCAAHVAFAVQRYRKMEELAQRIDRILHGQDRVLIEDAAEGELSILNSELQKMTTRLQEQANQLSEDKQQLTEAIQDIFHQIRTPLTSMNLLVSMLGEEDLPYDRRLSMTRELRRQLERVQWLVETLLKLSKIDAGTAQFRSEPVSVEELIEKAAQPLRIPMELREQSFTIYAASEHFAGDLNWTTEALGNILKNCMEHTPVGGTITVTTEETALFTEIHTPVGGTITVTTEETALFTEIVVEDNGPGISKEDLPYLFDRFYKGEGSSDDSVGIGLALSRSIIAAQNGTIKAENVPTGGARFTIRFYKSVI